MPAEKTSQSDMAKRFLSPKAIVIYVIIIIAVIALIIAVKNISRSFSIEETPSLIYSLYDDELAEAFDKIKMSAEAADRLETGNGKPLEIKVFFEGAEHLSVMRNQGRIYYQAGFFKIDADPVYNIIDHAVKGDISAKSAFTFFWSPEGGRRLNPDEPVRITLEASIGSWGLDPDRWGKKMYIYLHQEDGGYRIEIAGPDE